MQFSKSRYIIEKSWFLTWFSLTTVNNWRYTVSNHTHAWTILLAFSSFSATSKLPPSRPCSHWDVYCWRMSMANKGTLWTFRGRQDNTIFSSSCSRSALAMERRKCLAKSLFKRKSRLLASCTKLGLAVARRWLRKKLEHPRAKTQQKVRAKMASTPREMPLFTSKCIFKIKFPNT